MKKMLLSLPEISEKTELSIRHLRRLVQQKKLAVTKQGRKYGVTQDEFERFVLTPSRTRVDFQLDPECSRVFEMFLGGPFETLDVSQLKEFRKRPLPASRLLVNYGYAKDTLVDLDILRELFSLVSPGGTIGILAPVSLAMSKRLEYTRKALMSLGCVKAVVEITSKVFTNSSLTTVLVVVEKREVAGEVFMARVGSVDTLEQAGKVYTRSTQDKSKNNSYLADGLGRYWSFNFNNSSLAIEVEDPVRLGDIATVFYGLVKNRKYELSPSDPKASKFFYLRPIDMDNLIFLNQRKVDTEKIIRKFDSICIDKSRYKKFILEGGGLVVSLLNKIKVVTIPDTLANRCIAGNCLAIVRPNPTVELGNLTKYLNSSDAGIYFKRMKVGSTLSRLTLEDFANIEVPKKLVLST